jgi:pimeloyl-ACP methyl ester carboxylesterase
MKIFTDIFDIITNISWAADFSATIIAMIIGYIWYHPSVFGTVWARVTNLSPASVNSVKAKNTFLSTFPIIFIIAANIAAFCKHLGYNDPTRAFLIGYDLGLIACLLLAVQFLYEQRNLTHYAITAGYVLVSMGAMGLVIGVVL